MRTHWLSSCLVLLITTLAVAQKNTQGISGQVLWKAGNFMPTIGTKASVPKAVPVVREVYIYALTNDKQVDAGEDAGFYQKVNSKLVRKVKTDKKGRFSVTLPVGYYSVFTKEEKGLYANLFDDAMNINPVQVQKRRWTKMNVVVDYQAVY